MKTSEVRELIKDSEKAVGAQKSRSKGKIDQMQIFHIAGWIFMAIGCALFALAVKSIHEWWVILTVFIGLPFIYRDKLHYVVKILLIVGLILTVGLTCGWLVLPGIVLGIIFIYVGYECLGIQIVPEHERWILKTWRRATRKLDPGFNRTHAFFENVEDSDKVEVRERAMDMIFRRKWRDN